MMDFTVSDLRDLTNNQAWLELRGRLLELLLGAELESENPDPFKHGLGVGAKRTLKVVLELPEQMEEELVNKGRISKVGPVERRIQ